ncbi:hypothetical protein [Aquimarina sediminis]|uniref:hypothetical protein n=1 Tax=Aquimarina sediminis TaxID=2070536 RepID=UPI000CA073F3|nr:hypothetical protein [Aquimarina sediminis]
MYFEGIITIDPSEITKITPVKPTKAFRKLLHSLTFGAVSDKQERETFTAVGILQQINASLRNLGINNIIKISHDDIDFYHDKEGKENDLKLALDKYEIEVNEAMSIHFSQLNLILEHQDDNFKYLFEIVINREHKIGIYPIEIHVSGLLKEFSDSNAKEKIESVLKNKESFDNYKQNKRKLFESFLDQIKFEVKKQIKVDDVEVFVKTKHVLPSKKITKKGEYTPKNTGRGVYSGYYGFDDYIFYTLIWSDVMHHHHHTLSESHFENEYGEPLGYVDEINTDNSIFDSDCDDNVIQDTLSEDPMTINESADDSSSWFDFSDWDTDFDSSSFGCSSCSSCSSCASCGGD